MTSPKNLLSWKSPINRMCNTIRTSSTQHSVSWSRTKMVPLLHREWWECFQKALLTLDKDKGSSKQSAILIVIAWLMHTHTWIIVTTCYYWPDYHNFLVTQSYYSAISACDNSTVSIARMLSYYRYTTQPYTTANFSAFSKGSDLYIPCRCISNWD